MQRYVIISESASGSPGDRKPVFISSDPGVVRAVMNYLSDRLVGPAGGESRAVPRPSVVPFSRPPGPPTGRDSG
jgi:hypothetical protein